MFPSLVMGGDADVQRHWARMSSTDSTQYKDVSDLILSLKDAGVWEKIGILCVTHDNQADSLLNIKGSSTGAPDSTANGGLSFVANSGFTINGTSEYIDLGVTETTASLYGLYDGHIMSYCGSLGTSTETETNYLNGAGSSSTEIRRRYYFTTVYITKVTVQMQGYDKVLSNGAGGFVCAAIAASNNRKYRINDSAQSDTTTSTYTLQNRRFLVGSSVSQDMLHSAWGIGGYLTAIEMADYEDAIRAYAQARGFDVY